MLGVSWLNYLQNVNFIFLILVLQSIPLTFPSNIVFVMWSLVAGVGGGWMAGQLGLVFLESMLIYFAYAVNLYHSLPFDILVFLLMNNQSVRLIFLFVCTDLIHANYCR